MPHVLHMLTSKTHRVRNTPPDKRSPSNVGGEPRRHRKRNEPDDHPSAPFEQGELPPSDPARSWAAGGASSQSARPRMETSRVARIAWSGQHGAAEGRAAKANQQSHSGKASGHDIQADDILPASSDPPHLIVPARRSSRRPTRHDPSAGHNRANPSDRHQYNPTAMAEGDSNSLATTPPANKTTEARSSRDPENPMSVNEPRFA